VDAALAQNVHHPIDSVAFADATGIELHANTIESDGPGSRVESHMPVADTRQRIGHVCRPGQRTLALVKSPDLHQRSHRDVERAIALPAVGQAVREELEQLRRHSHWSYAGSPVHFAPFAVRLVIRQQSVEAMEFVEGGVGGLLHPAAIVAVQHDRKRRGHGFVVPLDPKHITGRRPERDGRQDDRERPAPPGVCSGRRDWRCHVCASLFY